ncbi:MAG: hypothetical protein F6K42_17660 [Leptolyngbya sp. SIO1D8]|nr:hypothetical protein [Leptolyngbya sp. SIO1D8]
MTLSSVINEFSDNDRSELTLQLSNKGYIYRAFAPFWVNELMSPATLSLSLQ